MRKSIAVALLAFSLPLTALAGGEFAESREAPWELGFIKIRPGLKKSAVPGRNVIGFDTKGAQRTEDKKISTRIDFHEDWKMQCGDAVLRKFIGILKSYSKEERNYILTNIDHIVIQKQGKAPWDSKQDVRYYGPEWSGSKTLVFNFDIVSGAGIKSCDLSAVDQVAEKYLDKWRDGSNLDLPERPIESEFVSTMEEVLNLDDAPCAECEAGHVDGPSAPPSLEDEQF